MLPKPNLDNENSFNYYTAHNEGLTRSKLKIIDSRSKLPNSNANVHDHSHDCNSFD